MDVEKVIAEAIKERMGPLFGSPEYLADPVKLARAQKRQDKSALGYAQTALSALTANGLTVVPVDLLAAALMAAQHSVTFPDVAFHLEKLLAKLDQPQ